nr:ribonuclease H-like domain-containing protein [Tanacetum cinerariifolium]
MEFEYAQNNTTAKLPILKLGEYEMWVIRIKQYFQIQDYALWKVIENGNSWEASIVSPNVNIVSPQVSTANFSDNVMYAFMVENPNGFNLLQYDLEQIHKDDLEAMDLRRDTPLFPTMLVPAQEEELGKEQSLDEEDASKLGRNIADIDADVETILVYETTKDQGRYDDQEMFDTSVLDDEEEVGEKKIIISEATIRRDLKFEDKGGVDSLSNEVIFEQLPLMGLDKEDASKLGRNIADIDADVETILVYETTKDQGRYDDQEMFDTSVLDDEEEVLLKEDQDV